MVAEEAAVDDDSRWAQVKRNIKAKMRFKRKVTKSNSMGMVISTYLVIS